MKVAAGKASHRDCPHLSQESAEKLDEMMLPPIVSFNLCRGDVRFTAGGEKVIYRHDESFYNPTGVFIELPSTIYGDAIEESIDEICGLSFQRVGQELRVDGIALTDDDSEGFIPLLEKVAGESAMPLLVRSFRDAVVESVLSLDEPGGVILLTTQETAGVHQESIKKSGISLALRAENIDEARNRGKFFREAGISRGFIAPVGDSFAGIVDILYSCRLEPLTRGNRDLGFPVLIWPEPGPGRLLQCAGALMKYASAVVTDTTDPSDILPLLTLRQNIFTDPRRPIQVEAKLYAMGEPHSDSPVLISTNFSLTYFTVAQEIEASRIPAHLLIIDTDGTSVLTAWSADKFNPETVRKAINDSGIFDDVSHRQLIIPGYVHMMKEELEEATGLSVLCGPREASGIPEFLRRWLPPTDVSSKR